ncbi:GNAT family N-acetyltransferase [Hymenobacter metallilatus]|uniref:GNAT family N-acetyltransferase n=1 Tax=Hymenobacter metallilatus TaxID=2493666 RepID=A0A3R9NJC6_9BACT|nr:GNAT family N-acetyltransferase [Hymenobacter metallilatus]RSK34542.1 GNAT family N-acetyltransferase [Hymenobacter metallilatus]
MSCFLPLPAGAEQYALRLVAAEAAEPVLPPAYTPWLYHTARHMALQSSPGERLHFFLEEAAPGCTVAQLSVFLSPDSAVARSPWQAPFGALQGAPGLPARALRAMLTAVEAELRTRGTRRFTLRLPAFAYEPAPTARLTQELTQLGYQVALAELNNHLPLNQDFRARLHASERRRLLKCERHGLRFEQEPPLLLPLAYEFLRRCRQEKGQDLSMTLEQLQTLFRALPDQVFLFSVRDAAGEWAALTIAIRVREDVLYNFYPASPLAYNTFSPVVLLNAGLHAFGQASGMRLLDLGTSTLPEGLNQSLLQFKRHLGGVPSLKLTLEKELLSSGL